MRDAHLWRHIRALPLWRTRRLLPGLIALTVAAALFGGWQLWHGVGSAQPRATREIKLPFAAGPAWTIAGGYNGGQVAASCSQATPVPASTCSSGDDESFALAFTRADGATADEPVLAPASGTIRWINPANGSLAIELGDGYAVGVTTNALDPALSPGQTVRQGQPIGTTTKPTVARNAQTPRIQMTLWRVARSGGERLQAAPFTGAHALDGNDLPPLAPGATNPYQGRTVVSSNEPVAVAGPIAPALKGPESGLRVAATRARVTLTWNPAQHATAYRVEINGAAASPWLAEPVWTTDTLGAGSYAWRVRARNDDGDMGPLSAPSSFTIGTTSPAMPAGPLGLTSSVSEAEVGAVAHLNGAGFSPGESVTVSWDGQDLATIRAGTNGAFTTDLTIPESAGGAHAITATGATSGRTTSTGMTVRPSLARGPSSASPGSNIAVAARGFAAHETVRLTWHTAEGPAIGSIRTDAHGSGTAALALPDGTPGWNDYTGFGETSKTRAWGAIEIRSSLTLSDTISEPGKQIDLAARGLPPGKHVAVAWNKTAGEPGTLLCRGDTDADGRFACAFAAPRAGAGTYPVTLTGGNDLSVTSALTVRGPAAVAITPRATAVGTNVTLALGSFAPSEAVALTLGGQPWRTVKVDANGALSLPTTVPPRDRADLTLTARGASSSRTATATFRVTATANAGGGPDVIRTGVYRVTATREGLVGETTSTGHVIVPNDRFVALPACLASNCPWLKPGQDDPIWGIRTECGDKCYVKAVNPVNGTCAVAPVWDVGPWFRSDDWWRPTDQRRLNTKLGSPNTLAQGYPGTEAARDGLDVGYGIGPDGHGASDRYADVGNRAAIDLADGTWNDLRLDFERGIASGIEVQLLWQTGQAPADAARGCISGPGTVHAKVSPARGASTVARAPVYLTGARATVIGHGKLALIGTIAGRAGQIADLSATRGPERITRRRLCTPASSSRSMALPSPSRGWRPQRRWRR